MIECTLGRRIWTGLAVLTLATSGTALAQSGVLVVDKDGGAGVDFLDIQPAVDAANEGDVILVKGTAFGYANMNGIVIDGKSIYLIEDAGEDAVVSLKIEVRNLAPNQSVVLAGFSNEGSPNGLTFVATDNAGPVWIDGCTLDAGFFTPFVPYVNAATVSNCANVTFVACSLTGGTGFSGSGHGLLATNSNVSLYSTALQGAVGTSPQFDGVGKDGARVDGGTLFASGCSFQGGDGASGNVPPFSCLDGGPGGNGLTLLGANPVTRSQDSSYSAGAGGMECAGNSPGAPGLPIEIVTGSFVSLPGVARSFYVTMPVREGQMAMTDYHGAPGELVWRLISGVQDPVFQPAFNGTLLPGMPISSFFIGMIPGGGVETTAVTIGLGPNTQALVVYEQPLYFNPTDGVNLGNGRAIVLLDSIF